MQEEAQTYTHNSKYADDDFITIEDQQFDLQNIEIDKVTSSYQADMLLIALENKLETLKSRQSERTTPDNDGDQARHDFEAWQFNIRRAILHTSQHVKAVTRVAQHHNKREAAEEALS